MTKAEQFIRNYTNHCSNELVHVKDGDKPLYHEWLTPDQAFRAIEIERDELLDKACEWLKEYANDYIEIKEGALCLKQSFIRNFRKIIKEQ